METAKSQMVRAMNQKKANEAAEEARTEMMANTSINMEAVDARSTAHEELLRINAKKEATKSMEDERGRRMSANNMKAAQEEMVRVAAQKQAKAEAEQESARREADSGSTEAPKSEEVEANRSVFKAVARRASLKSSNQE